jgi:hypothetical protein
MPTLTAFKNNFMNGLRANISANLNKYQRNDSWALELGEHASRDLPTRIELKSALILEDPDDENKRDLENAIRVHKLLRHLTPFKPATPGFGLV